MRPAMALLLFLAQVAMAQQKNTDRIDSLLAVLPQTKKDTQKVNVLNELSFAYMAIDSAKGIRYGKNAQLLSKELEWEKGISRSCFYIGNNYSANFNYPGALSYFSQSLAATSDQKFRNKILINIGGIYAYQSKYSKALDCFLQALQSDEKLGNKKEIAEISVNIGSVYFGLKDYPKAISFFNKALKINQFSGNTYAMATLYRNLGSVYNSLGETQKALDFFGKGIAMCDRANDPALKASIQSDATLVYFNLKDYDKAIQYSKWSLNSIPKQIADKQNTAFCLGVIGDSFKEKAKEENNNRMYLDSAVSYLAKAITLHKELNSLRDLFDDYTSLTETYRLQDNYKSALECYQKATVYKDAIFNADNKETIKNLEDKRTIELRNNEIKINRISLEAKERQKWYLVFGLALLGIIGCLLFYQSNNRRKTNRKLNLMNTELGQANKLKTRLLGILNHDLRSPVNSFIHFIQFQKENPELLDTETKTRIENTTLASAKNLLNSMEDILLWTKDQMENFEPQPKNIKIASLFEETKNHFSAVENIDFTYEDKQNAEVFSDENYLKTIVRNLTGNAIKALSETKNPVISWKAWETGGKIFLSITDNGPGAKEEQFRALYDDREISGIQSGLGLHLIRDLAKAIGCEITMKTGEGSGTQFHLSFQ